MTSCTPDLIDRALRFLAGGDAPCLLFGGWAEEGFGLSAPRQHADLDLVQVAPSFDAIDALLAAGRVDEITAKRLPHKRAFRFDGVMVEILQVRLESQRFVTQFWDDIRFEWLTPLTEPCQLDDRSFPSVSLQNLNHYRANFAATEPWRWKGPLSVMSGAGAGTGRLRRR